MENEEVAGLDNTEYEIIECFNENWLRKKKEFFNLTFDWGYCQEVWNNKYSGITFTINIGKLFNKIQ